MRDATLVGSHSEKEQACPDLQRRASVLPLWSHSVDHGAAETGEPLSVLLPPGSAGSNTATDHIAVIKIRPGPAAVHRQGKRAGHQRY